MAKFTAAVRAGVASRYRNPYFWFGLVSVVVAASGVAPADLTSWKVVVESLKAVVLNPVQLVAVVVAVTGVFVNPTTKGLTK